MIVELRQYTLHPGRRDELIELFEREFVTGQEAVGITLLGRFRDTGDPDRFVWLRGFPDMTARAASLAAFYGGPVWRRHRDAANATMIDSDDVLLLRPVLGELPPPAGRVELTVCLGAEPFDDAFAERLPVPPLAALSTEYAANNFPALPVREGEHAFVWLDRADAGARRPYPGRGNPVLPAVPKKLILESVG